MLDERLHPTRNTKLQTQRKILDAAWAEFSSRGLYASRIEVIAARAGVTRQLVYHYFHSKEVLYGAVLDMETDRFMQPLRAIDYENAPPLEVLRSYVTAQFDVQFDKARISHAGLTIDLGINGGSALGRNEKKMIHGVTAELVPKIRAVLERGKRQGVIDPAANAEIFHATTIIVVAGCVSLTRFVSTLLEGDYHSDAAMAFWREHTAEVMVRSVRRIDDSPQTVRPAFLSGILGDPRDMTRI